MNKVTISAPGYAGKQVSVAGTVVAFDENGIGSRVVRRGQVSCDEAIDEVTAAGFAGYPAAFTVQIAEVAPAPKRAATAKPKADASEGAA